MKALSKGKAAQFFKKQQIKQDPDKIINQAQARTIASQVGIAQQQIPTFKWFFDQLHKFKLPPQYQKQLNQKKTQIVYYDKKSKQSTTTHPLINLIRTFFYTQYKSNRSTFTFSSKQQKLLPYVEQKMMRNCISLNSKRRQVQKLNLQKDQNGNNVLSKMARIKPDIKSLVSARSYMLKMLVQKVYTCKQIWGKGKRAKAFANIINQKQKGIDQDDDITEQTPKDLQTYQSIFTQACKFYQQEYKDLIEIPTDILNSQAYKNSTPQNVLKNIFILNISKNQIEFYWFARLMDCLSIPHNWSLSLTSNVQTYIYEPLKLKFDIHPSYIYIIKQMNRFKDYFNCLNDSHKVYYYKDKQMTFFDFFQRQYTVDMYGLALKEQLKLLSIGAKNTNLEVNRQKSMQQNTNDWMIVEAIVNSQIKQHQYPLIQSFCNFWRSKYFPDEEWFPSVSPFGQVTWSSTVNFSSIDYCPYKQSLIKRLQNERRKMPTIQKEIFKNHLQQQINLDENGNIIVQQDSQAKIQLIQVQNERRDFILYFINNDIQSNRIPFNTNKHDIDDFFDQTFVSPFDLETQALNFKLSNNQNQAGQSQQVPIWIQKVQARKLSAKLKNFIRSGHDFDQILDEVKKYTIQTTTKHQPFKMQEMQQKIRNIKTYKQLQKFIQTVTDVQARQQRKRKAQQFLNQQGSKDDDIFGSEQEDINISQAEALQSSQSQDESQPEEQSQKSQVQQQPQQVSESQSEQKENQNIEVIAQQQPQHHQQDSKPKQDYSFLKDFQSKKVYQKSAQLSRADSQQLNKYLKLQMQNKTKSHKFSNSYIKSTVSYQLKKSNQLHKKHLKKSTNSIHDHNQIQKEQQIQNIKKNLIATNLKYSTVPYKNRNLIKFQNNQNAQQFLSNKKIDKIQKIENLKNITEFNIIDNQRYIPRFQSQMDDYEATQVIQHINSLPKKVIVQQAINQNQDQNPQKQSKYIKKQQPQIILQPIKRTKPDILQDARLRHINDIDVQKQLNALSTIFMKKTKDCQSPTKIKIRSKSTSNLLKSLQSTQNSQNSIEKSNSLLKSTIKHNQSPSRFDSIKKLKNEKLIESKIFPTVSNFNRVCLSHTASNFLVSQPIKRTSQLLVLQARKNLLHKGRGLDTYMSKKY